MVQHNSNVELPLGERIDNWQQAEFPITTVLQGHYCRVEPLDAELHAASLYEAYALDQQATLWTYLPYGPFKTFAEFQQWLLDMSDKMHPQFYAIVDSNTGFAIGVASYMRINPEMGSIEVGNVCFSPILQGTTAATEAMYLMMKKAFATGYRRYEWKCDALNRASLNAAKRLGFSFEGIFRQAAVIKGRNRDTAWFSVLDKEWPVLDSTFVAWLADDNFNKQGEQQQRLVDLRKRNAKTTLWRGNNL